MAVVSIDVTIVENISHQALDIICQPCAADANVGDIPYTVSGTIKLLPGTKTIIETIRLDAGQLLTLSQKSLIRTTASKRTP